MVKHFRCQFNNVEGDVFVLNIILMGMQAKYVRIAEL